MKKISVILLLAALLLTACNPLRRVQRNQKADSTTVDRSEIQKIVTDIIRESGTLSQTIIEYYPPIIQEQSDGRVSIFPEKNVIIVQPDFPASDSLNQPAEHAVPLTITPPAVKRIIKTEISTASERVTTTDSVARSDIHTTAHSELEEKVVEKPPSSVLAIKWIAIGLIALLLLILILKFSKFRLPRIKL